MSSIFETLFTLIPIALILAVRVIMMRKKQQESSDRPPSGQGSPPRSSVETGPAPRGLGVVAVDGAAKRKGPKPMGQILPAAFPEKTDSGSAYAHPSGTKTDPGSSRAAPGANAPGANAPGANAPGANTPRASAAQQHGVFGKIERLSPLKRAVVLSEVLGKPKGMEY
jgi:hypothetical protein